MADNELCPCGEPLHYKTQEAEDAVRAMVILLGPLQKISVAGMGTWMVPRHYTALHGFQGHDLPVLAEVYGWERVS